MSKVCRNRSIYIHCTDICHSVYNGRAVDIWRTSPNQNIPRLSMSIYHDSGNCANLIVDGMRDVKISNDFTRNVMQHGWKLSMGYDKCVYGDGIGATHVWALLGKFNIFYFLIPPNKSHPSKLLISFNANISARLDPRGVPVSISLPKCRETIRFCRYIHT